MGITTSQKYDGLKAEHEELERKVRALQEALFEMHSEYRCGYGRTCIPASNMNKHYKYHTMECRCAAAAREHYKNMRKAIFPDEEIC